MDEDGADRDGPRPADWQLSSAEARKQTLLHWGRLDLTGANRLSFSRVEAIRQSLDLIIPERLRERHWAGYTQVIGTGESRYGHGDLLSVPALRKDGSRLSRIYYRAADG
jgi:hypothetical protein